MKSSSSTDRDEAAKALARRQLGGAGSVTVTRPGAVFVTADRLAQLDQLIMEKRSKAAALKASATARRGHSELSRMEQDVAVKQQARWSSSVGAGGVTSRPGAVAVINGQDPMTTKPGAFSLVTPSSGYSSGVGGRAELSSMESDVAAKQQARASFSSNHNAIPGTVQSVSYAHHDTVSSKIRREESSGTTVGAVEEVRGTEDAVESKIRRNGPSTPGAHAVSPASARVTSLDDKVASKIRRETSSGTAVPGARTQLSNLEDAVSVKIRSQHSVTSIPGAHSETKQPPISRGASGALTQLGRTQDAVSAKIRRETTQQGTRGVEPETEAVMTSNIREQSTIVLSVGTALNNSDAQSSVSEIIGEKAGSNQKESMTRADEALAEDRAAKYTHSYLEQAPPIHDSSLEKHQDSEKPLTDQSFQWPVFDPATSGEIDFGATTEGGLAIAVAVNEPDEDIFIPSAIEYDPDAKPPLYKNRRFRLYGFLALFFVVLVTIGAVTGVTLSKANNEANVMAPTAAPTTYRESFGIQAQIERLVGAEVLKSPNSSYSRALNWIMYDDPMQITPSNPSFTQRYTAAYIYFATTTDGPWYSCNPPPDPWVDNSNCSFKLLTGIFPLRYVDVPAAAWLTNTSECEWAGMVCDNQEQVRGLQLRKWTRISLGVHIV